MTNSLYALLAMYHTVHGSASSNKHVSQLKYTESGREYTVTANATP